MHPYHHYVDEIVRLTHEAHQHALGGYPPLPRPPLAPDAPRVLIFAPHPDDECVTGALALRLLREARMRVVDVAVTQGSNKERQAARLDELRNACGFLGFELVTTGPAGLERINPSTRAQDPAHWRSAVVVIARLLGEHQPRAIFCPHPADLNSTHVGTHHLVMDALAAQPSSFECAVIETEFWAAMESPNLLVESSADDVGDLVAAIACHAGEVRRNPYHLTLPGRMQDTVRRGSEIVGGQGGVALDFDFATLYRLRRWRGGQLEPPGPGRVLSAKDDLGGLFRA
jgi:LmbE family N-acetylglucosaminyl deacetylase